MSQALSKAARVFLTLCLLWQAAPSFAALPELPPPCSNFDGPEQSCVGQVETYLATTLGGGYTYSWSASPGGTLSTLTGPSTLVNWTAAGAQWVALTTTAPGGATTVCTLAVTVYPRPAPAIFSSFISDCPDRKGDNHANGEGKKECWVVCENMTIQYSTNDVPGNTYQWVVVGGTPATATGTPVNITWGPAGTGMIILTETTPGGCSETIEQCVTIVESPNAWFSYNGQDPSSPLVVCLGQTVYFNDQSTGGAFWYWDFGDGNTSTLQNPSHTYASPGTYNGTLTVKNECGCISEVPFEIIVTDKVSPEIGCISTVCIRDCAFYSVSNVCPGGTVTWSVHGGQIINQVSSASINIQWDDSDGFIAANGYGEICVTVTGCDNLCDGEVCVRVPVIHQVAISGETVVCVGEPVTYSVPVLPGINEPGGSPDGVDFDWAVSGNGTIISSSPYSNSITVVWNAPGSGTVTLGGYENPLTNGDCRFGPAGLSVTVKPTFSIYPQQATICLGDSESFSTFPAGTFDWTVSGPGGIAGPTTVSGPYTVTPAAPGVYAVSAQSNTGAYCNITPTAVLEVLAPPPAPSGSLLGEVNVCLNTPYVYTFNTPPPPGAVLVWDIAGGTLYGGAGPTVTAEWTGGGPMSLSVRYRLTESPFCESAALSFPITEYAPPSDFVNGPASVCVDELHNFNISGLSNYTDLQWSVSPANAGSVVAGQGTASVDVQFTNTASGTVQIVCTAIVCGAPVTDVLDVTVNQIPAYTIVSPATACQNELVNLSVTPSTGIASYSWDFGDGSGSSAAASFHSWAATGTYPINVDLTLNICGNPTVTVATTIQIDPVPVAYVTASNGFVICPAAGINSTTLTVATQIFCTYSWSTGTTGPTLVVTAPGTYTVTATDPVTGCSAVVTRVVGPCPTICNTTAIPWDFTFTENCDTYTFVPISSGSSNFLSWSFGDLTGSASSGTQVHTYDHPGYYQVTIFSYDPVAQCTLASVHTITVKFKGNFTVNFDCSSGSMLATLDDISEYLPGFPATTPDWFEGGYIGTGASLSTTFTPGLHSVYLQVVVGGQTCVSPTQTFTAPGMPSATIGHDAPKCEGLPVQFNASGGGGIISYDWDFGDGAGSGLMNPQRAYSATGSPYTVTLTVVSEYGCSATGDTSITIIPAAADPVITLSPATPVCEGTPVLLTATGALPAPVNYTWYNSADPGTALQGPSPANTYAAVASGLYGVSATDGNGCPYNVLAPDAVTIYPPPYLQITGKTDYCLYDLMLISADIGPGFSYFWTVTMPSGSYTSTAPFINLGAAYTGTYTFAVTITDNVSGCTNSGSLTATVHAGPTGLSIAASAACAPATLNASASGAVQFNWSNGTVGASTNVLQGGFYSVVASDAWGCTAEADYFLQDRPDLSNVMTGCYEFCEEVVWQAPNCGGCTYQWTLNGSPIPGETNATINISSSGVYTVIVSNGPGCETESDPIDISISLNPELCEDCRVDIKDAKFICKGIDPQTGLPLYEFWIDVVNYGGALYGLTAVSGMGTVTLIDPASGYLPGGGAISTVHGYLSWNGGPMDGCISFLGYLTINCVAARECKFEWCGELPPCCEDKCDIRVREARVECLANGFYQVTLKIDNNGCDLFNLFIKTPFGTYPLTPSTLPANTGAIVTAVIVGSPGSMGVSICGTTYGGKLCCVDFKLQMPECPPTECELRVEYKQAVCTGYTPDGFPVYQFGITVSGVPPGSDIHVLPGTPGMITGVSYSCAGGVCNVQGTYTVTAATGLLCLTVVTVDHSSTPPKVCKGKICFAAPPCPQVGKPASGREQDDAGKRALSTTEFYLAPNPAMNEVRILGMADAETDIEVQITDMTGRRRLFVRAGGSSPALDISTLPAGMYLVTITDSIGTPVSRKLTVVR